MSSARYKHDILDMGDASSKLLKLRPVGFRYNNDPTNTVQYGLVAEEVARVYPELVVYGRDGKVETVRYQELAPMLLNELQKQDLRLRKEEAQLREQLRYNQRQAAQIQHLTARVEQQAEHERQLSAGLERQGTQIAQMKMTLEQAMATQKGTHLTSAAAVAFSR